MIPPRVPTTPQRLTLYILPPFFSGVEINFRLWRILLLGVVLDLALGQRFLQLANLCRGEVGVVFEIHQLRELLQTLRHISQLIVSDRACAER